MAPTRTTLLVMDESKSDATGVFSIVGLVVPVEQADPIRLSLYSFMRELEGVRERFVSPPPELTGKALLPSDKVPWAMDDHRIRCFEFVVETLKTRQLQVVRSAYYKSSFASLPGADEGMMYQLCYQGVLMTVGRHFAADSYVIPMMDWLDYKQARALGASNPLLHAMRVEPGYHDRMISLDAVGNFLEPVFVDSEGSSLIQIADLAAYLLHVLDLERAGGTIKGSYKPRVLAVAHTLDMSLVAGAEPTSFNQVTPGDQAGTWKVTPR